MSREYRDPVERQTPNKKFDFSELVAVAVETRESFATALVVTPRVNGADEHVEAHAGSKIWEKVSLPSLVPDRAQPQFAYSFEVMRFMRRSR